MPHGSTKHIPRRVQAPGFEDCQYRLAPEPPARLVVFVHGWKSSHLNAWPSFHDASAQASPWWRESDMLFLSYDSRHRDPAAMADELREVLLAVYPRRPPGVAAFAATTAVPAQVGDYAELHLVGHSLGGTIVRRMVADLGLDTRANEAPGRQRLLADAQVRLFSPALGGFDPKGDWWAIGLDWITTRKLARKFMKHDAAYQALQQESGFLQALQRDTERLARERRDVSAFTAQILWANPDTIVDHHNYERDDSYSQSGVNHRTVCKPRRGAYEVPWHFVEHGDKPRVQL